MLTHREPSAARRPRLAAALSGALALALAAGCAPRRAEPPARPAPVEGAGIAIPAGARVYDIDPAATVITLFVYRAGPLARLGHNHVLTSGDEAGVVWQGAEPAVSGFELRLPVRALVVDDPAARAAAGPEFAGEVPAAARDGTYQNLLRTEVLDASRFPEIVVRSTGLSGTWDRPVAMVDATLKGEKRRIDVPITLERADGTLTARGRLSLRQTDFGMTPFSVAGGAIQVADAIEVEFSIVARAR